MESSENLHPEEKSKKEQLASERVVSVNGNVNSSIFVTGDHNEITNISRLVVYLTTQAGYSSQEIQKVVAGLEQQLKNDLARDRDIKSKQEIYITGLEHAMQTALGDVEDDTRHKLLYLTTEWTLPVIENCRNFDDHHSPYGQFCFTLLQSMYPSLNTGNTMSSVIDWIFTSRDMLVTLPRVKDRPIVYLELLSKYFPVENSLQKPQGYYLVFNKVIPQDDKAAPLPIIEPLGKSADSLGDTTLQILCMPGEYVGRLDPSSIARRTTLTADGEKVTGYEQNVHSEPENGVYSLLFSEREMHLVPVIDTWHQDRSTRLKYSFPVNFKYFSNFLLCMMSDFLRLGSSAISYRQTHTQAIDQLRDMLPKL